VTEIARAGYDSIRRHSKSFSLASRLLPPEARPHAVAVYAWCRRADDAVDLEEHGNQQKALAALTEELRAVYDGGPLDDPVLALFQWTVVERKIPIDYPMDLLTGMEMDVGGHRYDTLEQLLEYCYYVAGCVGLMMCHVMGVSDERALRNAAHLGMAMQLTNVCRDVEEDWGRGRLYLPDALLARSGAAGLAAALGGPFPVEARPHLRETIAHLLDEADRYYASGDRGLPALSWRCALSIRAARLVYSAIGDRIRRVGCDPLAGRAIVPRADKLALVGKALAASAFDAPGRLVRRRARRPSAPTGVVRLADVVALA
jgi:15-cis-phytoene synthase